MTNQLSDHEDHFMRIAHARPFTDLQLNIAQILARGLEGLPENDGSRDWMENVVGICLEAIAEAVQVEPENVDELVSEKLPDLRQNLETVIRCSRACDGYSTMTPIELADRVIDAVVSWYPSTLPHQRTAQPEPEAPEPGYEKGYAQEHLARLMRDAIGTETNHNVYIVAAGKILDRPEFAHVARWGTPTIKPVPVSERPEPEGVGATDFEEELMAAWDKAILLPRTGRLAEYRAWLAHVLALVWAVGRRPTIEPVPVAERLPEPGKKVLAYYLNSLGKSRTILAEWVPAKTKADDDLTDGDFAEYDEGTDEYYWPEGWYEAIENSDDYGAVFVNEGEITHWQPLPRGPHHALPLLGAEVG